MKCIIYEYYKVFYFFRKNNKSVVIFRTTNLELAIKKAEKHFKKMFSGLCTIAIKRIQILESKSKEVSKDEKWMFIVDKLGNVKKL